MKTSSLFNKTFYRLAVIGLLSLSINSLYSQQVKKKIVRVIEVDDKGERVVKEYNVSNDAAKFDSITRDVHKKMQIERIKMDSLEKVLMINIPENIECPPMPEMPDMPDFDIDVPDAPFFDFNINHDFDFFVPDSESSSDKVYYSERSLDKSGDLDKMLKDLENGTFDPAKYNMKEVEKDKIKDFRTKGKGEVIVLGNRSMSPRHIRQHSYSPYRKATRNHIEARIGKKGHRMIYIKGDSLNKKDIEGYTIMSSGDLNEEDFDRIIMRNNADWDGKHSISGHHMAFYSFDSDKDSIEKSMSKTYFIDSYDDNDEPNFEKVIVGRDGSKSKSLLWKVKEGEKNEKRSIIIANDNSITKYDYLKPNAEEFDMLEKSGFLKVDKAKLLADESLILIPPKDKDRYIIKFKESESGKVKVIIANENGKTIKTEEFEHSKGKTEKEIEIKDFTSGIYFIQAQLNGKTTTSKLEIKID
ncbi:MAG: T9SS C-terminal target domain-containing protein [Bacteroidales bacterium]|nr:MAG: T9SS C-terminal target domain-containing protein [Bacteroidales bacterium]